MDLGASGETPGATRTKTWSHLGGDLEPSLALEGWSPRAPVIATTPLTILTPSWGRFGQSWGCLGLSWCCLGPSWGCLGLSSVFLAYLGTILEPGILRHLWHSRGGRNERQSLRLYTPFLPFWGHLGAVLAHLGGILGGPRWPEARPGRPGSSGKSQKKYQVDQRA